MLLPVFSNTFDIETLTEELIENGIIVVLTLRTHASKIALEIDKHLTIQTNDSDDDVISNLIHLTVEVRDRGWDDLFIYPKVFNDITKAKRLAEKAVYAWIEAGEPNLYYYKYK